MTSTKPQRVRQPMWPALVTLAVVAVLHAVLPDKLAIVGHRWILASAVLVLAVTGEIFHLRGMHKSFLVLNYAVLIAITFVMICSVYLLVRAILTMTISPDQLLSAAAALWLTNIALFAVWYWRLDAGGPHERNLRKSHTCGAFQFPQMVSASADMPSEEANWSPHFVDYLFLAFNTSTALSPTDSPVLSRWAKLLMMIQSLIAMAIIVLLAARAVNILPVLEAR